MADVRALHHNLREWVAMGTFFESAAGGTVLLVRKQFLRGFDEAAWRIVWKGRCLALDLNGGAGALSISAVHAPNTCDGIACYVSFVQAIVRPLRRMEDCHSIIAGDWNFVFEDEGRHNMITGEVRRGDVQLSRAVDRILQD